MDCRRRQVKELALIVGDVIYRFTVDSRCYFISSYACQRLDQQTPRINRKRARARTRARFLS